MKKIILILIIFLSFSEIYSQNLDSVISQISKNNLTLKSLQKSYSADSVGNKTGIYLQNPEIEFNYLFGSPNVIGNRNDFSVSQTFDFPTAYTYKRQIAETKNQQISYSYSIQKKEIETKAKLICIDLVYYNLLINEYENRLTNAEKISKSYKAKFEIGEANILEYNKAELNKLNISNELNVLKIEQTALQNQLTALNGNIAISFTDTVFTEKIIPIDFEVWFAEAVKQNPMFEYLKSEIDILEKEQKLNTAMSLPKFKAGYMSEFSTGQNFQGITVGLTVPLWENKNKNKYTQLKTIAATDYENTLKIQFYNELKILHSQVISMKKNIDDYKAKLQYLNNSELLYKALDKGEIGLIDYILELSLYYESYKTLIEMERNYNKAVVNLFKY